MDDPLKDKRFSHVVSDPRFRKLPRSERKVKIDSRFKAMFTDDKFKLKYAVDKRGRPVEQTQADNLKKYYELTSGSEEESGDDDEDASDKEEDLSDGERRESENDSVNDVENSTEEVSDVNQKEPLIMEKEDHSEKEDERVSDSEQQPALDVNQTKKKSVKKEQLRERSKLVDGMHKDRMKSVVSERLKDLTVDYARGIGSLGSDESSSDESTSEDSEVEDIFHPWGELANDAEETEEATARLAACNLDWDRITARDLFMLFTSFLPPEGFVKDVTIYPSEFGLQRMKEEELKGPKELFENPKFQEFDDDDFTDKHAEGSQYCMEKLREYQLNRLRYYYAVITFNSPETANKIYTECDGIEYESSATKMDLRFIPDDMEFEHEPKDSCTSMPDVTKYKPRLFVNSALQQGTVRLTWDETDLNRVEFTKKLAGGEKMNDDDLQAYIAASSDSSEEDEGISDIGNEDVSSKAINEGDPIAKYKALLSSVTNNSKKHKSNVDMEVSWGVGLGEKDSESEPEGIDSDAEDTKRNDMRKEKSKNRGKKSHKSQDSGEDSNENAELQLLLADDVAEEGARAHFNFKDIQKEESRKKKKRRHQKNAKEEPEDKFEIDVKDSRFSALFTSHHFNVDPADPRFVRTEAAEKIIQEKQKRRKLNGGDGSSDVPIKPNKPKMNAELASLVKSLKGKQSGS